MGYWCSLHLFDDKKFYREVVPQLRGEVGDLTEASREFLRYYSYGGISHFSEEKINSLIEKNNQRVISISKSMDQTFKIHYEFDKITDYKSKRHYLGQLDGHYEFCEFMQYYLFKTCADFNPNLGLGKGGVSRNFTIANKTISCNVMRELDYWSEFFAHGMTGITNWITHEDVELLFLDKENLHFDDNELAKSFLELLDIAYKNKLGFIMGVDMRESQLELLYENKLLPDDL
ncbi:hypothetical protein [Flavobacterium sp. LHD-85]|uniref:hypothetical protein n=1 Tax=Flavobacterium sp. LHD-85 TaxID=3071410 RepID=UPI0027E1E993|nr:hypothetical protein [Flavobacterium sp. LHD-85]MDQ6531885.1 hypothetical protein [Flavobacterium sp. LHD-85]